MISFKIIDVLNSYYGELPENYLVLNKILSLMGENEIVVSDSPDVKHGALHGVRNLECEADHTDVSENTNDAALETRIDSKEDCHHPFEERVYYLNDFYCNCCKQLLTYDNLVES